MHNFVIPPIDSVAADAAAERQSILTKPPGSLGKLEEIAWRLAGIQGTTLPTVRNRWIVVAAADHGVTGDSVSAYPQEVTAQMVRNFLSGGAAINVLARHCGARLMVVDAGIRGPVISDGGSRVHRNDGGEDGNDEGTFGHDVGLTGTMRGRMGMTLILAGTTEARVGMMRGLGCLQCGQGVGPQTSLVSRR